MNLSMVQNILGLMLMIFSLTMLPPVAVSLAYQDGHLQPFLSAFLIVALLGALLWFPVRRVRRDLRLRDGFLVVTLFWFTLGLAGATPFLVADVPEMSFTDAVFEAVSGFTTTGATVLTGIETLPKSILYYRQQIQWFGGMGIIVLAVALLPILGVGGMSLYKAETPGPVKDDRLTPRIAQTAKALWFGYLLLTAACAACYYLAGMDTFDAVGHAFTTLSTGGFSTHDAGLEHFGRPALEYVAIVFMLLGGTNFALHYLALARRSAGGYLRDAEFRTYVGMLAMLTLIVSGSLYLSGRYGSMADALRHGAFQVVSMQTSTGYVTAEFAGWPGALPALLMLATFIGGCAGSTAGGMKVLRWLLVSKQAVVELRRLVHPRGEILVRLAKRSVPDRVMNAVTAFFAIYLMLFGALTLLLMAFGLDQTSAWSAVATSLNNTGPALGSVAVHFTDAPDAVKWTCALAMIIGRLELFTLIVIFTPDFWRR